MTLLITIFAATISTGIWYKNAGKSKMNYGMLCWMYWGASLMWFVDALVEYIKMGSAYFTPAIEDMVNDTFLGLAVVALGMVIWSVSLLIKDPEGVIRAQLFGK